MSQHTDCPKLTCPFHFKEALAGKLPTNQETPEPTQEKHDREVCSKMIHRGKNICDGTVRFQGHYGQGSIEIECGCVCHAPTVTPEEEKPKVYTYTKIENGVQYIHNSNRPLTEEDLPNISPMFWERITPTVTPEEEKCWCCQTDCKGFCDKACFVDKPHNDCPKPPASNWEEERWFNTEQWRTDSYEKLVDFIQTQIDKAREEGRNEGRMEVISKDTTEGDCAYDEGKADGIKSEREKIEKELDPILEKMKSATEKLQKLNKLITDGV